MAGGEAPFRGHDVPAAREVCFGQGEAEAAGSADQEELRRH